MALTDIDFAVGDNQNFLVELPVGTLNAPVDIVIEEGSDRYPILETPVVEGNGDGDIFIIND